MEKNNEEQPEDVKVGVFVCHCGSNIGGLIDCKKLADYAQELPNVKYSEDNLYTCSETGLTSIKKAIQEYDLNRVVVASCTPRTHEPLFRKTIEEAGLNQYLFNFVNIRDQCTWVHMKEPERAFQKAKDLIKMGVSKASKLEALDDIAIDVVPSALIIGGGVTGMSAALSLSNLGYKTYLIEKERSLGGKLNSLYKLFPDNKEASSVLEDFKRKIENANNLEVFTSAMINDINGFVGNYEVKIAHNQEILNINTGVIIVAVGAEPYKPEGLFNYDGKKIITQFELENRLKEEKEIAENIVMILCAGARSEEIPYCSNVCCTTSIKNALILKEKNSSSNVTLLFRDIYTPGTKYEELYKEAREKGIIFIKYSPEKELEIQENQINVYNEFLGEIITIPYELIVLSTPLIANDDNKQLAKFLKVPLEDNNFFLEAHVKLRPVDFATEGVFLGGSAKWPTNITEAISQGYGAAARANTILSHSKLEVEGATANLPEWNKNLCKGCEVCIKVCPFNAIKKNEDDEIEIIKAVCKGCGTCTATCTQKALTIYHFTDDQILSEIHALGGKEII
jgi:heterodisulfide reductase subunit A